MPIRTIALSTASPSLPTVGTNLNTLTARLIPYDLPLLNTTTRIPIHIQRPSIGWIKYDTATNLVTAAGVWRVNGLVVNPLPIGLYSGLGV